MFTSKYASYVERDFSDLTALQVICGDHSQRDLTVVWEDGKTLVRPWLTLWQDLFTGLLYGWHLDLTPSSRTAGLAYANGIKAWGAQPLSRPEHDFFSYVYTDQGKDYKSRNWDGLVIEVHKQAFRLDGGMELLRVERKIGLLDELGLTHVLARGYNAREKPVERTHRDISDWEQNTFNPEYCGRDAKIKPDSWREAFAAHTAFVKGKRAESPFIGIAEYREALTGFIHEYNTSEHTRSTLGGNKVVPVDLYRQFYTTRYEVSDTALALLLMRGEKRVIRKNGVGCSAALSTWHYLTPEMAEFKGQEVEVRFNEADLASVWVYLPNSKWVEAPLLGKSSFNQLDRRAVETVKRVQAKERNAFREFDLANGRIIRGESVEDRAAAELEGEALEANEAIAVNQGPIQPGATIHRFTRMDSATQSKRRRPQPVTAAEIASVETDDSIFTEPRRRVEIDEFE